MTTELVPDTLEHAIWARSQAATEDLAGLVQHTDAGSQGAQYTSFAFTSRLIEAGVDPSVGSVGDAYDNALAEPQIGLFKTELIRPYGPWRDVDHVELETMHWVHRFKHDRPHESIDDRTPTEAENAYYAVRNRLRPAGERHRTVTKGSVEALHAQHGLGRQIATWRSALLRATELAGEGFRVLALTSADVPEGADWEKAEQHLLGLVAMNDPAKPAARSTIEDCRTAGIVPVLITGDHPATARAVALRVGVLTSDEADH